MLRVSTVSMLPIFRIRCHLKFHYDAAVSLLPVVSADSRQSPELVRFSEDLLRLGTHSRSICIVFSRCVE